MDTKRRYGQAIRRKKATEKMRNREPDKRANREKKQTVVLT
jgi:hypothetical protein